MVWQVCFGIMAVAFIAGVVCYFRKSKQVVCLFVGTFIAGIALWYPGFYVGEGETWWQAFGMSIANSLGTFAMGPMVTDLTDNIAECPESLKAVYKFCGTCLMIFAPLLTFGTVLHFFTSFMEYFRLQFDVLHCNLYIFSELNEGSLSAAKNIRQNADAEQTSVSIVFCRHQQEETGADLVAEARQTKAKFIDEPLQRLLLKRMRRWHKTGLVSYFAISEDSGKNVDQTMALIDALMAEKNIPIKRTSIYCYSLDAEAEILLDAKENADLKVILVDEVRDAVYHQLFQHPLNTNMNPLEMGQTDAATGKTEIRLLIAGGGKFGREFLKAAAWYGQMCDYHLKIYLIDPDGKRVWQTLHSQCPELKIQYIAEKSGEKDGEKGDGWQNVSFERDIVVIEGDLFAETGEQLLEKIGGVHYCVAALGDDEENIRAGIFMRRYAYYRFASGSTGMPYICVQVQSPDKESAVWEMHENGRDAKIYYHIAPFGNYGELFNNSEDTSFMMEYLGMGIHFLYVEPSGKPLGDAQCEAQIREYYNKQSNRRSSIASGMHIKMKLWEQGLGMMRRPMHGAKGKHRLEVLTAEAFDRFIVMKADGKKTNAQCFRYKEPGVHHATKNVLQKYYELEHERWHIYQQTEGWRVASRDHVTAESVKACYANYHHQFKNQNHVMKLHPAMVPYTLLNEVGEALVSVNADEIPIKNPNYGQSDAAVVDKMGIIVSGGWFGKEGIQVHDVFVTEKQCLICRLEAMVRFYRFVYENAKDEMTSEEVQNFRENIRYCSYGVLHFYLNTEVARKHRQLLHERCQRTPLEKGYDEKVLDGWLNADGERTDEQILSICRFACDSLHFVNEEERFV